jgi:signal transduction histidine kinase/ActR/RegA family two-component response regulator
MQDVESLREQVFELQRRNDAAQASLHDYSAIVGSMLAILAAPTVEDVENVMHRGLLTASGARAVAVLEARDDALICVRASQAQLIGAKVSAGALLSRVLEGHAIAMPDIRRPPDFAEAVALPGWEEFRAAVAVPYLGPVNKGVLILLKSDIASFRAFDADRFQRHSVIASQGMAAIYRHELALARAAAVAAREEARASETVKTKFFTNLSHEIRTPLNGMLGMAQALTTDALSAEQQEKISVILESGHMLRSLLNDVLDLSKIEAGKLEISAIPGNLHNTLSRASQLFRAQAEEKNLQLCLHLQADLPELLAFDPVRVGQCISNLLSNAIKFTERGRIDVTTSSMRQISGAYMVIIEVSDTGVGVSSEAQTRLFSAFNQADETISQRFGGTGLGLAISRHLARLMGGNLTVQSEEGQGSTFRLTFNASQVTKPVKPAEPDQAATNRSSAEGRFLRGTRVLVTDDNAINRRVIRLLLDPLGCQITEAANGKDALDQLANKPFDIVLLDIRMPIMDGEEAIKRIRSSEHSWSDLPVIALTADSMHGDRERCIALGMSDYVPKPVDKGELIAKMCNLLDVVSMEPVKTASVP